MNRFASMSEREFIQRLNELKCKAQVGSEHAETMEELFGVGEWDILFEIIELEQANECFDDRDRTDIAEIREVYGPKPD